MAAVLKTAMGGDTHRGFESHALRFVQQKTAPDQRIHRTGAALVSRRIMRLCAARGGRVRLAVPNTCPSWIAGQVGLLPNMTVPSYQGGAAARRRGRRSPRRALALSRPARH